MQPFTKFAHHLNRHRKNDYSTQSPTLTIRTMYSSTVQDLIMAYRPISEEEKSIYVDSFINTLCQQKVEPHGQLTGAAWIIDTSRQYTLLCNQGTLGTWLPLRTHLASGTDIAPFVVTYAQEVTDITEMKLLSPALFNIDVYKVHARQEPEHTHYELGFLIEAEMDLRWQLEHESKGLSWINLDDVYFYNDTPAVMRMVEKTRAIYQKHIKLS